MTRSTRVSPETAEFPGLTILLKLSAQIGRSHDEIERIARLPARIAETEEIAGQECQDFRSCWQWSDCRNSRTRFLRLRRRLLRLQGVPRMQILSRLPRSPSGYPKFAGITDIGGQEWDIRFKKLTRLPAGVAGSAQIAENADISTIAVIAESLAWDCWDSCGQRCCRDCRRRTRGCLMRLKRLRDYWDRRDCRPRMLRLLGLLRVPRLPILQTDITEIATDSAGRHCREYQDCRDYRDCWLWRGCRNCRECSLRMLRLSILSFCRDCRPTFQRLLRMQILPRFPRVSPEIAGITDLAGREWQIARGDSKKLSILPAGIAQSKIFAERVCDRESPADIAETAGSTKIAETTESAEHSKGTEIAESMA